MVQLLSDNFLISCSNVASQKQKYLGHSWNSLIYLKYKLGEKNNTSLSPRRRQLLALIGLKFQKYGFTSWLYHGFSDYMGHNFKAYTCQKSGTLYDFWCPRLPLPDPSLASQGHRDACIAAAIIKMSLIS